MKSIERKNRKSVEQNDSKSLIQKNLKSNTIIKNKLSTDDEFINQTNSEIADQGYTIRNGHNPNKPNPYEEQITNDASNLDDLEDDFDSDEDPEEEFDDDGALKIVNDEFDNPSDLY